MDSAIKKGELQLIDSHCHMQFPQYDVDRDAVITRALDAGVGMIVVGTDFAASESAVALADRFEHVWASVGLHPNDELDGLYDEKPYSNLLQRPGVVAVGEIGLDFFRTKQRDLQKIQIERFERQLSLASRVSKPVIIHCRDAHDEMKRILGSGSIRGVIHSFTGTKEDALWYVEKGLYLGLNGIVTFSHIYDDLMRTLPLDSLLIETDSPYLAPPPHRGQRNEPLYVREIAKYVATVFHVVPELIQQASYENTRRLFAL